MSQKYAVFVTMQLKSGMGGAFGPHIVKNAQATRDLEPDNHAFNVMVAEDDLDRYHFFEVYTDQDALARHRETPHFKAYQAATADMVLERSVQASYVVDN